MSTILHKPDGGDKHHQYQRDFFKGLEAKWAENTAELLNVLTDGDTYGSTNGCADGRAQSDTTRGTRSSIEGHADGRADDDTYGGTNGCTDGRTDCDTNRGTDSSADAQKKEQSKEREK